MWASYVFVLRDNCTCMSSGRLADRPASAAARCGSVHDDGNSTSSIRDMALEGALEGASARPRTLANAVGTHYAANGANQLGSANLSQSLDRLSEPSGF